jgi:hypothetical protein
MGRLRLLGFLLLTASMARTADFPKAFLADGQIWIQMSASQAPVQATHDPDGTFKSDPVISPDGKLIAYGLRESIGGNSLSPLRIVFIDWSARETRRFHQVAGKELGGVCGYGYLD